MQDTIQLGEASIDGGVLADLCRRYGVRELAVFGSAARGEMTPDSDIDVLVEFEPDARVGIVKFESLVEDLAALARRRIDLVTKRGLKPWLRDRILADARVIYAA